MAQESALYLAKMVGGCAAGFSFSWLVGEQLFEAPDGSDRAVSLLFLLIAIAPVAAGVGLYVSIVRRKKLVGDFLNWFFAGLEVGLFWTGARVLVQWYLTPENPHMEPLFVAVGIVFASTELSRQMISSTEALEEHEHDSKGNGER